MFCIKTKPHGTILCVGLIQEILNQQMMGMVIKSFAVQINIHSAKTGGN